VKPPPPKSAPALVSILKHFDGNNPLSIVIMDNASIHHVDGVVRAIEHNT